MDRKRLQQRVRTVIKESRLDSDMSQGELGKKTGMTRNQIANLESGRRDVQVTDFVVIATALGMDASILLGHICEKRISVKGCPACQHGKEDDNDDQSWLRPSMDYSGVQHCRDCGSYFRRIIFTAPMRVIVPAVLSDRRKSEP
jgi:transcriptional regulator with XRE-family HTH domain